MVICPTADAKERIDSERNQGRAPDMSWLDHDRLGFNYRLSDVACALGVAQLERLDSLLSERSRVAELYGEALADIEGIELPYPDTDGNRRSWFVYVVQLPAKTDRDAVIAALAERGIDSKAYLPCIHLMPHYMERFGFRGGEFPVAEEASRRSLALPFFTAMGEAEVECVVEGLAAALGRA
jgi:perosamine synthetase